MTHANITATRDAILEKTLPDIPFDGWTWDVIIRAGQEAGFGDDMIRAVFPEKIEDVLDAFSEMADRRMLDALRSENPQDLKIRDRIKTAVAARFKILQPHKEALRESAGFWAVPFRQIRAAKIIWRTADRIWDWAGDTATDYNRYTKRALLSGILTSTTLVFLNDPDEEMSKTLDFLEARINNVLKIGGFLGKITGKMNKGR